MNRKRRQKLRALQEVVRGLEWSNTAFYYNRPLEKWEEKFKKNPDYALKLIPKVVDRLLEKNKITVSEGERLIDMFNSSDVESKLLVVGIIKQKSRYNINV